MYKKSLGVLSFAIIGTLIFGTIALADIISGLSTTNISNDVMVTQLTLSNPSDTTIGDLLLANVSVNGGSPAVITPPSGWTPIARADNDTNVSIASFYKIVGTSDSVNSTWNISPQTHAVGGITNYRGINTTNPIDSVGTSSGRGVTATAPSVITSAVNDRVIALFTSNAGRSSSALFSTTSGMIKKYNARNTPFGPTTAAEDAVQVSPGATGSNAVTISGSKDNDWAAQTITLKMKSDNISSLHLQKSLSQYAFIPSSSTLALTGNLTIEAWIKFDSLPNTNDASMFINKADGTWAGNSYGFGLTDNSGTTALFFGIVTNGIPTQGQVNWSPTPGNWYHLAVVYDTTGTATFYVNGVNIGIASGLASSIQATSANLCIGQDCGGHYFFDGGIDEVRLYSIARTQSQIQSDFTKTLAGTENNLSAYWSFSNNLNDSTSNHNDLTTGGSQFSTDIPF